MNELTNEERKLLEWVLQEVKDHYNQPLESLTDVCESIDWGLAPEGLERPYYGMSYKHQIVFLAEYIKALEE